MQTIGGSRQTRRRPGLRWPDDHRRLGYRIAVVAVGSIPLLGGLLFLWAAGNWSCADSQDSATSTCDEESISFLKGIGVLGALMLLLLLVGLGMIASARNKHWIDDGRPFAAPGILAMSSLLSSGFGVLLQMIDVRSFWFDDFFRTGGLGDFVPHGFGALGLVISWCVLQEVRSRQAADAETRLIQVTLFVATLATFIPLLLVPLVARWVNRQRNVSP